MRRPTKVAAGLAGAALLTIGGLAYALGAAPAQGGDSDAATTAMPATAEVVRTTVQSVQDLDGALGYADAYTITNALATTGWVDPLTAAQAYAAARAQYDAAVSSRAALSDPPSPEVTRAEASLAQAQAALVAAEQTAAGPTDQQVAQAKAALAAAQAQLATAQAALDALTAGASPQTQAALAAAEAGVRAAQAALDGLDGNDALARANLAAARAQLRSTSAALDAVLHPTKAQRQAADDAVKVARAQLDAAAATLARPRGLLTELPAEGSVVQLGEVLYMLDGTHPVVLLSGDVPAWRELKAGVADGPDVQQLEANLTALGFGSPELLVDGRWDAETTAAAKRWEASLGLSEDGIIPLGEIVFEPGPIRVTTVRATLGDLVQAGAPMFNATATTRQVTMALDADQQDIVSLGAAVRIELADSSTTSGTIADIGTVAVAPKEGGTPQITVTISLDDPAATGTLDGSPVTVEVVRDRHENVLAVPIEALLALREGGYGVEVMDPSGATHLVGVTTGLFENDLVEVTTAELKPGDRVVVPG